MRLQMAIAYLFDPLLTATPTSMLCRDGDHTKSDEGVRNEIEAYFTTLVTTLVINLIHADDALSVTSCLEE